MQTGDAILSLCCTSSWTVTHAVRCQRHFALILVVFLGLREAFGRKRVVAAFAQKHGEAGQGARHLSPTPKPCRSCCGTSPGAVGRNCRVLALSWHALQLGWFSQDLNFQWSIICQKWMSLGLCKEHPLWQQSCHGPSSNIGLCLRGQGEGTGLQIIFTAVKPGSRLIFWGPL